MRRVRNPQVRGVESVRTMHGRRLVYLAGTVLFLALASTVRMPAAAAAVAACSPDDATDKSGDVATSPVAIPDPVNGFNRLDLLGICFTETATSVQVVVTVGEAVDSNNVQSYHWIFHFSVVGTAKKIDFGHANGQASSAPAGAAEASGAKIQFTIAKTDAPAGTNLTDLSVESTGTFVNQAGQVFTGSDRLPDAGPLPNYEVGKNAPPDLDTDKDGVPDRQEVKDGTDPSRPDTDNDGLSDGDEKKAGTNPRLADTDGDGLSDGDEVHGTYTIQAMPGMSMSSDTVIRFPPTDPRKRDTDGDGLTDLEEILGSKNHAYRTAFIAGEPGSTNPTVADTDGDGLNDGDEVRGHTSIDGKPVDFTPTDPNDPDTDHDGLSDLDELRGLHVTPQGQQIRFSPSDPTKYDTDGDGFDDGTEVASGHDPTNPNDHPSTGSAANVAQYFPVSSVLLLLVVLVCTGGIFWRWS